MLLYYVLLLEECNIMNMNSKSVHTSKTPIESSFKYNSEKDSVKTIIK
jgi:hypothetical protein